MMEHRTKMTRQSSLIINKSRLSIFHWTIYNINFSEKRIVSPTFTIISTEKWELKLLEYNKLLHVEIKYPNICFNVTCNIQIALKSFVNNEQICFNWNKQSRRFTESGWYRICDNIPPNKFGIKDLKELKTLIIECSIDAVGNFDYVQDLSDFDYISKTEKSFAKNFSNLLEDKSLSDICIIVDGVSFLVHKVILGSQSSVFAAMFKHNMKESRENVIKIDDISAETMESVISYIYKNSVENIEANALELLKVAEKYDLPGLKIMCENSLCQSLTFKNVLEMLTIADLYNATILKSKTINFVKYYLDDIIETSAFQNLIVSNSCFKDIIRAFAIKK